jgi:hypothetical protein
MGGESWEDEKEEVTVAGYSVRSATIRRRPLGFGATSNTGVSPGVMVRIISWPVIPSAARPSGRLSWRGGRG